MWGLFYFLLLLLEKTTHLSEKLGMFSHVYTLLSVCLAWVVFRAKDLAAALHYLATMFNVGAARLIDEIFINYVTHGGGILILTACILSTPVLILFRRRLGERRWYPLTCACTFAAFVISLLAVIGDTYNPFIYFNF